MILCRNALFGAAAILAAVVSAPALAGSGKTIVDAAAASPDHTTLVAAVTAAGLADTLAAEGPFTVFAPVNEAFAALPEGTVDTLLEPANKDQLVAVLTYHVVPGRLEAADLVEKAKAGGGTATVETVQGENLTVSLDGDAVIVTDAKGGSATVTVADLGQANGVIHVIDAVLLP
ncbi:putative surface protein with fasciclin (FAS1) repeats [Tepidamorphus gemmatus]|uniref:Putative surface protein with fasciclin (FAS1) repeats n=1 Tax=Tepidamorphus gemmatus TaxID=747076 RepID=A0A4R3M2L5_9HYPH|nr:fasciclin domain-containing protein [Tepidamorphus gemmatus]TCT06459.1 putative surface protein with fasciclin (FAS1) repeats [Tepidamorphus gemmatus]